MDQNEAMNQLMNNPQMMAQMAQMMQQNQNRIVPNQMPQQRMPANWNVPTNPMAMMWLSNMFGNMNNMNGNRNVQQPGQNQNQVQQNQVQQNQVPAEKKADEEVLPIRVVKSPEDIKVYHVPMSDRPSLFLQDDLRVIYGKRWNNNGDIDNMVFVRADNADSKPDVSNNTMANNTTSNPGIDTKQLMLNIATLIDNKLEQFKNEYKLDALSQGQNKTIKSNSRKAGDGNE